jgi:hypothetical protein
VFGDEFKSAAKQAERLPPAQRDAFLKANSRPEVKLSQKWVHLWEWFSELSAGRGDGFNGPAHITHEKMQAWRANFGRDPSPLEARLLFVIDEAWRAEISRLQELKRPKA